ncbi:MAG TPA: hypothetical protein VN285_11275 [Candidatus Deferrimicrobium sp.]|nr:hypothetical protein [Candidatus Deferrimicrobium sp.]
MWPVIVAGLLFILWLYVTYKQIEFFVTARNLYKSILNREDQIVRLLLDIRDNTKAFALPDKEAEPEIGEQAGEESIDVRTGLCKHCGQEVLLNETEVRQGAFECPTCGKSSSL